MKRWKLVLVLIIVVFAIAGCGSVEENVPTDDSAGTDGGYVSEMLDATDERALNVSGQLALGTLELEETENAVIPDQAAMLLPLWQALQGGVTAQEEISAVLAQIETLMTPEQLEAIASMALSQEDMAAWAEENGLAMPFVGGGLPDGGQDMSDEERAAIRATMEAGGGRPGGFGDGGPGGFGGQDVSDEERAAIQATRVAGGGFAGGGRAGAAGRGMSNIFVGPLVELLTQRATE